MKDICFTQPKTCLILPQIKGKTSVQGLILYQKIVVLMLSSQAGAYRAQAGTELVNTLQGANIPVDSVLLSIGTLACSAVRKQLDPEDDRKIQSLTASVQNGGLSITLKLTNGESYTGVIGEPR